MPPAAADPSAAHAAIASEVRAAEEAAVPRPALPVKARPLIPKLNLGSALGPKPAAPRAAKASGGGAPPRKPPPKRTAAAANGAGAAQWGGAHVGDARTFGSTTLDPVDVERLLLACRQDDVVALRNMGEEGLLGKLRNCQNHHGDSPLILAAWYDHRECARLLLDELADTELANRDGNTALNCAAYRGHLEMARLLLEADCELDTPDGVTGKTALLKASYAGHTPLVIELLEAGADVDADDERGYTSLAFAASFGHHAVVDALLDHHAVVDALLEYDADVDLADDFGITPLIHASARGDAMTVQMLLDADACVALEDDEGRTALDYADSAGWEDIYEMLAQSAIANPIKGIDPLVSTGEATQRALERAEHAVDAAAVALPSVGDLPPLARAGASSLASASVIPPLPSPRASSAAIPGTPRAAADAPLLTPRVPSAPRKPSVPTPAGVGSRRAEAAGSSYSSSDDDEGEASLDGGLPSTPRGYVNAAGTPRGFRGMAPLADAAERRAARIKIGPTDLARASKPTMSYLSMKLLNLTRLLEQDTVNEDAAYPSFQR